MKVSTQFRFLLLPAILLPACYFAFRTIPREKALAPGTVFIGKKLADVAGENIILIDTARNIFDLSNFTAAVHLVVFYSSGCAECDLKQKAVRKISQQYMKQPFRVIYIRSGKDAFTDFLKSPLKKATSLYDEGARLSDALAIHSFPTEILLDEEGFIRNVSVGYEPHSGFDKEYLHETKGKIDSLLSRAKTHH
jgi:thioredoxin-related protein